MGNAPYRPWNGPGRRPAMCPARQAGQEPRKLWPGRTPQVLEKNQRYKSILSALLDMALLFAAFLLANYLRFNYVVYFEPGGAGPALAVAQDPRNFLAGAATSLLLVLAYWVTGVYSSSRLRGLSQRCTILALCNAAGVLVFVFILYLMHLDDYSRVVLALFYILATAAVVAKRMVRRWYDRARRRKGLGLRHVLLLGGGKSAAQYLRALEHNPYYGFVVDGYLASVEEPGFGVACLGGYDRLDAVLENTAYDEVVVALEAPESDLLPRIFSLCDKHGVRVTMVPFYSDYLPARPTIDVLDECKLINVRQTPFDNILNAAVKRGLDIVGSIALIVLTSPVMLVTAVGVKLSSPGPVIFKQERIGLNKKPFMMYKFRSMRVNAKQETGWSTDRDPRKTRFGSLIRKFSIDELPQFFNVLKGDMSLVGPRPEVPYHVEHFKEEIPRYLVRQQVRPGCTGWAQIHGLRGDTDIAERIRYDIWYIENWTVALDIKIIFRTVFGGKMVNDEKLQ